jgi:hypothetical protein
MDTDKIRTKRLFFVGLSSGLHPAYIGGPDALLPECASL